MPLTFGVFVNRWALAPGLHSLAKLLKKHPEANENGFYST